MKKIIVFVILLMVSVVSFSQQTNPSPSLTKQDYLKKSKSQKTAAWVLLGGGAALLTYAATGDISLDGLGAIVVVGGLVTLSSIPLFIASSKNKRRAMSLSFKNETIPQLQNSSFVYSSIPSLSLKISL